MASCYNVCIFSCTTTCLSSTIAIFYLNIFGWRWKIFSNQHHSCVRAFSQYDKHCMSWWNIMFHQIDKHTHTHKFKWKIGDVSIFNTTKRWKRRKKNANWDKPQKIYLSIWYSFIQMYACLLDYLLNGMRGKTGCCRESLLGRVTTQLMHTNGRRLVTSVVAIFESGGNS